MLRIVNVAEKNVMHIPAIVHVDGSARVQTMDKRENREYGQLIDILYKINNVQLLLNTSFSFAVKPIVETPQDAVDCFEPRDIDVWLMEDWIISKGSIEAFGKVSC
jgi:carbamoyltransferase